MLVRKCDNCKEEIKQLNEALVAGTGFPEFSFRERCGKLIITFFEETQASSTQDDRIGAPSDSSRNSGPRLTGSSFASPFSHGVKHLRPQPLQISKAAHSRAGRFFVS